MFARHGRLTQIAGLVALLSVAPAFTGTPQASAQCVASARCNTVGADGKGILGGGILGAEIGFMIPALIVGAGARELDEWWAYVLFPLVFAGGGAVAGYFALEAPESSPGVQGFPEAAVAVFAVSMALIVPTFVGVLALTSYSPGASEEGTGATSEEDAEDDGEPPDLGDEEDAASSALRRTLAGGPGLLRYDRGQLLLGVPMVYSVDSFTQEERAHMQLGQMQDLRVPLFSGVF